MKNIASVFPRNRILDRAIRTEDVFADSNKIRLFQIMNREADVPTYEEQVKRNFEDWQPIGGKRRGGGRGVVEGATEGE